MGSHDLISQLEGLFTEFKNSPAKGRKLILPRIELICSNIQSLGVTSHTSQCCSRIISSCKQMARLKQPNGYNDSKEISNVLGDISFIDIE